MKEVDLTIMLRCSDTEAAVLVIADGVRVVLVESVYVPPALLLEKHGDMDECIKEWLSEKVRSILLDIVSKE